MADEIASWPSAGGLKFYEVLKSSQGARKQPLLIAISSAGYENEGPYDELFKRATRLLKGDSRETRFLPIMYTIDDPAKWDDVNEWQKSNPNLGVSVSVDYLLEELAIGDLEDAVDTYRAQLSNAQGLTPEETEECWQRAGRELDLLEVEKWIS